MIDKKQRTNLRATFLLVCLLPTCLQIWWIVEPSFSKHFASENQNDRTDPEDLQVKEIPEKEIQVVTKTETKIVEVPKKILWLSKQGIEPAESMTGSLAVITHDSLPPEHWLKKMRFDRFTIQEYQGQIAVRFEELNTNLTNLQWLHQQFLGGNLDGSLNRNTKPIVVEVGRLTISRNVNEFESHVSLPDVQIQFSENAAGFQVDVNGRVSYAAIENGDKTNETGASFRWKSMRAVQSGHATDISELETNGMPIWLVDPELVTLAGNQSVLQGSLTHHHTGQLGKRLNFNGVIQQADCASLTAYFASDNKPLAHGSCSVNVVNFMKDQNQIVSFQGELQSTGGAISSRIVDLFKDQVKWVASNNSVDFLDYRSFLFIVEFVNGKLKIQSKYKTGQQLVWSEVADILVANRQP